MAEEKTKTKTIAVYESTHHELQMMAVRKKLSIKNFLKELVEREKVSKIISEENPND